MTRLLPALLALALLVGTAVPALAAAPTQAASECSPPDECLKRIAKDSVDAAYAWVWEQLGGGLR